MEPESLMLTLAAVERQHILHTLIACHGNRTRAAKLLGISLRGLRGKLHSYVQSGCVVGARGLHRDLHQDNFLGALADESGLVR
jgi:hypothetical protein